MNRRLFTSVLFACLLPFMVQAQQAVFRFAQLTDIHLSPNNPKSYGRFIAFHCTN